MEKARVPQVNLAVVGGQGVGKSTFIKFALDLNERPISRSSIKKMSLDGTIYQVRLLEVAIDQVTFDKRGHIVWPSFLGEQILPAIDGVLALYDSTDLTSLARFPRIFDATPKASNIPFVVVACKCETPVEDQLRHDDPATVQQATRILARTKVLQTSASAPESYKKCVSAMLQAVINRTTEARIARPPQPQPHPHPQQHHHHQQHHPLSPSRDPPAAATSLSPDHAVPCRPPRTSSRKHSRAVSELQSSSTLDDSTIGGRARTDGVSADSTKDAATVALTSSAHGSRYVRSNSQPVPSPRTPPGNRLDRGGAQGGGGLGPSLTAHDTLPEDPSPPRTKPAQPQQRLRTTWRHSAGSDAFNSFLDMEDETDESVREGQPPSTTQDAAGKDKEADDAGMTFDELVDRLLSVPLSKQDGKFVAIFLCLYRKFATPARLLDSLVARFERIENGDIPLLLRHADQLRLLNVMGHWVSEYAGDFAGAQTRKRLLRFIAKLERNPIFAFAAKEMESFLERFVEDEDASWSVSDDKDPPAEEVETFLDTSAPSSPATFVGSENPPEGLMANVSTLDLSEEGADLSSQYSNISTASSMERSGSISGQSFKTYLSVDAAQQESHRLEVIPRNPLTKAQWRLFMETPDEEFARELTRIDWIMYCSFRPRELIRHVSASVEEKEKPDGRLENVNRMIREFNHLAYFAANMVLLRDKPKHRAQALDKLTSIAGKLRQHNNYNSLGAIIAGINGTPVYRLSQTRDMLSANTQKQFMSLVILMGTQKSHFAYRLAWDNTFSARIPFIPLHLRDLVSAEEGNKTFVGENNSRINWRKFEVMGEVVLGVQQSQKTPYPAFPRNDLVQRLLLETKMSGDEEELYNRSMHVEPSAGSAEPPRKRFPFRRA